jgi:arylesterase/paraoxonase
VNAVEISEQDTGGSFVPRETVRDPMFVRPNAIAAVGPRQFYLVNHRPSQGLWQERLDLLKRSGNSTLVYFDGVKARVLVDDLAWPAGLALSADGKHLYVGEALAKAMRVYRREADGALTLERTVALDAAPANLDVDADGRVWIAAHRKLLRFLAHGRDAREHAPTVVLRFDPRDADAGVAQVFADDGSRISAGTVAAPWRDQFLIGALFDKKVLVCKQNP